LGIPDAQAADTEALEKRIRELEGRLAKNGSTGSSFGKTGSSRRFISKPAPAVAVAAPSPEVEKLNRKVNTWNANWKYRMK